MASMRTSSPAQSSVRTPSPTPTSVTTPSTASMRTSSPAPSSVRTPSPASPTSQAAASDEPGGAQAAASGAAASFWLPGEMSKTIPVQDQRWIANTLFQNGKLRPDLKLWYEPPDPALIYHQTPTPDSFFTHQLMVWMPYHMWKVRLSCPVCLKQLTDYGVHKRARKVLDVDRYYLMVTETLRCTVCSLNYLSTSQTVRDQLDLAHQTLFRPILTHKYACDIRVIRQLRNRTPGSSPARLVNWLKENHREKWLNRSVHYLGECAEFVDQSSPFPVVCQEPPEPIDIPTSRWLLTLYNRDIFSRLEHIKACVTSTFGSILKMDSTKKITKKLAGHGEETALWMTSLGNEVGQVLTSVISMQEGPGLDAMASGIMRRYRQAAVPPPVLLYVDSGCCVGGGTSKLQTRFAEWRDLHIRLDIWQFMRRLAAGCTTDTHPLYPTFIGSLSACIFEWDAGDLTLLRRAKRQQLGQEGVPDITDRLVDKQISKAELSQYCRRTTRGEETTITLIERLFLTLGGANCGDRMVPLLDKVRMEHIWRVQKRHVRCIQDVPGVQLYTEAGTTTTMGGVILTKYRCARGSTSLESFHCHLNRFIPGTSANTLNFQLYLLECLNRWNQDCGAAAVTTRSSSLLTYARDVAHCVNTNCLKLFGRALVPNVRPPAKYTGELLGVDYLLSQTGQPLKLHPDSEDTEDMLEDVDEGEEEEEEEEECFEEDPTLDLSVSSLLNDPSFSSRFCPSYIPPASSLAASSSQPVTSSLVAASSQDSPLRWHNKSVKREDTEVVIQELDLSSRLCVAASPLLPANVCPPSAPSLPGPAHQYHLPGSTAGQAQLKRKVPPSDATQAAVNLSQQRQLFPAPVPVPQLTMLAPITLHGPFLVAAPQALGVPLSSAPPARAPVRKLTRKVEHNTCKKCGQFRTAETGHSQYKGTVYCPSVEALPKEQWLEVIKQNPK
ncbi:uncharacterized protein LOC115595183 [Sparus aurata]|uniref:uncharacterized protein LOC115595183 n=1 Tax=Sparus aurata TaxID=8175 RepID=UPI0011C18C12|nr:uncharacterized protein LOC115595183 [Sparus aurata]XP_030295204.1 uncharacterized protein LOC115595183 [Sparus aurata]XP_030295205.1 uncharacterized protein LOC115595183 [Sparus aurata]